MLAAHVSIRLASTEEARVGGAVEVQDKGSGGIEIRVLLRDATTVSFGTLFPSV